MESGKAQWRRRKNGLIKKNGLRRELKVKERWREIVKVKRVRWRESETENVGKGRMME